MPEGDDVPGGVSDMEVEIRRLRMGRELSGATAEKARQVAALWMEQDARASMLKDAPPDVAQALRREYAATGFMPDALRVTDNGWRELAD